MREIKFRAKYKLGSIPVLGQYLRNEGEWIYGELRMRKVVPCIYDKENHTYPIDKETVGQFSGLKDKNGKDIYEGDIVKHPYIDPIFRDLVEGKNGEGVISEVVFHDGSFVVKYDEGDFIYLDAFTRHNHIEVVGNMYDNPELLKR